MTREQGEYQKYAEFEYQAEMALHERSGQPSVGLATAKLHMGIAYNMNSLYRDAIPYLEESAEIRRNLPNFKKDWLFSPYYQLAHSHFHLGEDDEAAKLLQDAIKDRREVLGDNDRFSVRCVNGDCESSCAATLTCNRTGALYYTLGDVKYHQGHFDQSLSLHLEAETHLRLTVGPTNIGTLHCKYKIAVHYIRIGDYEMGRYDMSPTVSGIDSLPSQQVLSR